MKRQATVTPTECSYPECTEKSVGSFKKKTPLCKKHIELAEFFDWIHSKS